MHAGVRALAIPWRLWIRRLDRASWIPSFCATLTLLVSCHRAQFVTLPAPQLASAERHFAERFHRSLHIEPQIENGALGAGVRDSSMRELPEDIESVLLDSMATWLYDELGRPRAVKAIVMGVQMGSYVPSGIIWQPKPSRSAPRR